MIQKFCEWCKTIFLGFNDVGYHNVDIKTPNIDQLARSGVILEQNYVNSVCTPTRAALLTGTYSYRMGFQVNSGTNNKLDRKLRQFLLLEFTTSKHIYHWSSPR